ncbi:MAG: hypothetical protein JRE14_13440 [Deltaproteobacteria bacterium]|nr:hypothetical protein [Deltaproteobacteria bacterium]
MKSTGRTSPSYLIRNSHSYCFRMFVPQDLQACVGKKELRYSLKTGYIGTAKLKARYVASQVQMVFIKLRKGGFALSKLTDKKIKDLVHQYIKKSIDSLNEPFYASQDDYRPFDDGITFESYTNSLDSIRQDLITNLNLGDHTMLADTIETFLKDIGIGEINKESKGYRKLSAEIHKAEINLVQLQQQHMNGEFVNKNDLPALFPDIYSQANHQQEISEQTSETFKQAAEAYWNEYAGDIKNRSGDDCRGVVNKIVEHFGPKTQLHTIEWLQVKAFRDGLKTGKYSPSGKPLSPGRVNLFLIIFNKMHTLAKLKDRNLDRINLTEGLRLKDKRRADEKQDIFTIEELKRLFVDSKEYGNDKHIHSHNFWIPLIALYTGARLEEICQLLLTDVTERDGIWCLSINETDAPDMKSVKSGERRIIPLHPFLIEDLRFIEYVKSIPKKDVRVFPKLKRVKHRWGTWTQPNVH